MKRLFDLFSSLLGVLITLPITIPAIIAVFLQDFKSPFYLGKRVGENGKEFSMIKIRSMIVGADKTGVESTSSNDERITKIGQFVRKWKLDELSQLLNVIKGDMSLVGPRPTTKTSAAEFSDNEKKILSVKPGITDFASIVFSDEGEILKGSKDPDGDYNKLIRPWKSKLGLIYIDNQNLILDIQLILLTILNFINRKCALKIISSKVLRLSGDKELAEVCLRENCL